MLEKIRQRGDTAVVSTVGGRHSVGPLEMFSWWPRQLYNLSVERQERQSTESQPTANNIVHLSALSAMHTY